MYFCKGNIVFPLIIHVEFNFLDFQRVEQKLCAGIKPETCSQHVTYTLCISKKLGYKTPWTVW